MSGRRGLGALARWVLAANAFALAAALALSAPTEGAGRALREFMAWCAIG